MTVSAQTPRNVSTAVAGATVFPYSFKVILSADMQVIVNGVVKTLGVDYTLSGVGLDGGGDVTFTVPMVGSEVVVLRRNMTFARATDYQVLGDLHADSLNKDADAPVLMAQQLSEQIGRSLQLPVDSTASAQLPALVPGNVLVVKADGSGFGMGSSTGAGDMLLRGDLATALGAAIVGYGASTVKTTLDTLLGAAGLTQLQYLDDGTGAAARTLDTRLRERLELSVLSFIPQAQWAAIKAGTSTYNAGPNIQAAVDAIAVLGGGTVFFPQGIYRTLQTILVSKSNTTLRGLANGIQVSGQANIRASALSRLEWDPNNSPAAGTAVVRFAPPVSSSGVGGGGITDLFIDGQTVCPIGLDVVSWNKGWFNRVTCYACTADHFLLETANYALTQSVGATQNNRFTDCWASTVGGSGWYLTATANGFRLQGGSSVNTGDASYNVFDNCRADMSLGVGYYLEACGQDIFRNCSASALSTLAAPTSVTATPTTTGGTLAAGLKSYKIVAYSNYTGEVAASTTITATTTGSTGKVTLGWVAPAGRGLFYAVFGRTSGGELFIGSTASLSFIDTGAVVTPAGAVYAQRPGYGMVLGSTDQYTGTGTTGVARYHAIYYCEMSIWARASNQVAGVASFGNMIYGMSNGNGNLSPVMLETPTNNTSFPQITMSTSGTGGGSTPATVSTGKLDLDGNVSNGGVYFGGTKVLGAQVPGWTASTGTANKGAFAADQTFVYSASYVQAEHTAVGGFLLATRQRIKALEDAMRAHGMIN